MSYDVRFSGANDQDAPEQFFLCSTGSWQRLVDWIKNKSLPALKELAREGEVRGTDKLAEELAVVEEDCDDEVVRATAGALAETCGVGAEDETCELVS